MYNISIKFSIYSDCISDKYFYPHIIEIDDKYNYLNTIKIYNEDIDKKYKLRLLTDNIWQLGYFKDKEFKIILQKENYTINFNDDTSNYYIINFEIEDLDLNTQFRIRNNVLIKLIKNKHKNNRFIQIEIDRINLISTCNLCLVSLEQFDMFLYIFNNTFVDEELKGTTEEIVKELDKRYIKDIIEEYNKEYFI